MLQTAVTRSGTFYLVYYCHKKTEQVPFAENHVGGEFELEWLEREMPKKNRQIMLKMICTSRYMKEMNNETAVVKDFWKVCN